MKHPFLALTLLLGFCFGTEAQMLDNSRGDIWGDDPGFNREYIRKHKIKSITGVVSGKKVMHQIANSEHREYYNFFRTGTTRMYFRTIDLGYRIDTNVVYYEYDNWGRKAIVRRNDEKGFLSKHYHYNQSNLPDHFILHRDFNDGKNKIYFLMGGSMELHSERFEYYETPSGYVIKQYNEFGKEYKNTARSYNRNQQLIKEVIMYAQSSRTTSENFSYNGKGQLVEKELLNNWSSRDEKRFTYTYDMFDNVAEEEYYKGGIHRTHTEYLYKDRDRLYAKLVKDMATGYIKIIKFEYEYYRKIR